MTSRDASLADLVGDVRRFAEEHWGRRPLIHRTDLELDALFDVCAVEALLLASARRPTFRLVQDGERLPPERSTSTVRMAGAVLDDVADVSKIAAAVDAGATLVLQGLQRTWPPLMHLCRRLERELSHPVQANAYLTPAGAAGLARHRDEHDVLVVQLSGTKVWDVDGMGDLMVAPGDVLYLPAGTEHAAHAPSAASLHLTIGILRVTYGQVLRRALAQLDGVDLDAPVPLGYAHREDRLAEGLRHALREASAGLAELDPAALAEREARRSRTWRAPLPTGQLASVLELDQLDASTVVAARPDRVAHLEPPELAGELVVLRLHDRRVELPAEARAALEHLLTGEPTKVGELPGLSPTSRLVVVRRLVREGLLVIGG